MQIEPSFSETNTCLGRRCTKCGVVKPLETFTRKKANTDIRRVECKQCRSPLSEEQKKRSNKYRKEWRVKNKERLVEYQRIKNKRSYNDPRYAGYKGNRSSYLQKRIKSDPVVKFKHYSRVRIRKLLNRKSSGGRMIYLLGCTAIEAVSILTNGTNIMPLGHHIDHHIPVSHFDLQHEGQQLICFNWRNLRLITAYANLSKHDTLPIDHLEVEKEIRECLSLDSASL